MRSRTSSAWSVAAVAALLVQSVPASASPMGPKGPWRVDYDDEQCLAQRDYGSAEKPLIFALKPSAMGGVMRILVVRRGGAEPAQFPATVQFGDSAKLQTSMLAYGDKKTRHRVVALNVPMGQFKAQLAATAVAIRSRLFTGSFDVSGLKAVFAELEKCLIDLQDYWNVREPKALQILRPATPEQPLETYFSPSDYPAPAVHLGQSGKVMMAFLIDEQGSVRDCSVETTSGSSALDTMSCYAIRTRAKFSPAVGLDGKPIKSYLTQAVTWQLK